MSGISSKSPPGFNRQIDEYSKWKKLYQVWEAITKEEKKTRGGLIILALDEQTREEVLENVTIDNIKAENGADQVIEALDTIFKKDDSLTAFEAYENFEIYTRPSDGTIGDHCHEFNRRYQKVKATGTTLSDPVLAYRLLKSSNLSDSETRLIKATTSKMTHDEMAKQLKKAFNGMTASISQVKIKEEREDENETLYGASSRQHNRRYNRSSTPPKGYNYHKDNSSSNKYGRDYSPPKGYTYRKDNQTFNKHEKFEQTPKYEQTSSTRRKKGRNPLDMYGNITRCQICDSVNHWRNSCPDRNISTYQEEVEVDNKDLWEEEEKLTYEISHAVTLGEEIEDPTLLTYTCETMSVGVLDSGAPNSVCGSKWLKCYLSTLSEKDKKEVTYEKTNNYYKFGCCRKIKADQKVTIPAVIGEKDIMIKMDTVEGELPLLLSRQFMKKTKADLNFEDDTIQILGQKLNLILTESGHYALPLGKNRQILADSQRDPEMKLTLHAKNMSTTEVARKLHRQFSHPPAERLIKLVRNQNENCKELVDAIKEVTENCKICLEFKKAPPRPIVGFPIATRFGQCVAMDLKQFGKVHLLHMIDHATRLSAGCIINSKKPAVIIRAIFKHWISVFGTPECFLSDNGGEFNNSEYRELAEKVNITIKTTAAESAWSNGLVERHNGIIGGMILKTQADVGCSLEMALTWCLSAHNSLANVHGFSPFQLVLGRNPRIPSISTDNPPALNCDTMSDVIRDNLNALHKARQAHIKSESDEKIKRALRHNIRTSGDKIYLTGDKVYYKRADEIRWRGPGTVIGKDGQQVLVKHGGVYVRVHPCRLTLEKQTVVGFKDLDDDYESEIDNGNSQQIQNDFSNSATNLETENIPDHNNSNDNTSDPSTKCRNNENSRSTDDQCTAQTSNLNNSIEETEQSESNSDDSDASLGHQKKVVKTKRRGRKRKQNNQTNQFEGFKPKALVKFRENADSPWQTVELISRSAKKNGKYGGEWNTENADGDKKVIHFGVDTKEWEVVPPSEIDTAYLESYCEEDCTEVYHTKSYLEENEKEVLAAKVRELDSWKKNNVYIEVENKNQKCVAAKWVVKPKLIDGKQSVKARLVLKGYQEDDSFRTDSPACKRESVRLALAILATSKWKLRSIDFKTAFLQGKPIERVVHVKPPKEAKTSKLWKLNKTAYGLKDAPREWYLRLREKVLALGCNLSTTDYGLFFMHQEGKLIGLLILYVDDILFGGNDRFLQEVIEKLKTIFEISSEQESAFKYLGISIMQAEDGTITVDQKQYINNIKQIPISSERSCEKDSTLTSQERTLLKSVVGKLNWATGISRPDLGFLVGTIMTSKNATVKDILTANKIINQAQNSQTSILFPRFKSLKDMYIQVYTDASNANLPDGSSQGGHIVFLTDGEVSCPIAWHSKKIQRVVRSTLAAETLAAVDGCETAYMENRRLTEMITGKTENMKPLICVTDNYNLFKTAKSTGTLLDKRLHVEMGIMRQMVSRDEVKLEWCKGENQTSDVLTKMGASGQKLRDVISSGKLN